MVSHHSLEGLLLSFLLSTYFSANYAQLENPEVMILQGNLLGTTFMTRHNRSISGFLGIPYAQPPIGDLRFAKPVAADGWDGTRDARTDANICPQMDKDTVQGVEDCLYINVYTPQLPENTSSSLLPVMVWVHGGAFKTGGAISTLFGPQYLLDEDVVFVTMSYRIGLLGFLSTGDKVASGNWGLKDQIMALEWIQNNIEYFGGDPDQVTLLGSSAGAVSVHLLSLSDASIGLFHRYVTQSGSALAPWAHRPRAAYASLAFEFGKHCGCFHDTSDSLISCLRTVNVSTLIPADSNLLVWRSHPEIIWGPTDEPDIEGAILTDSPSDLFAAGKIRDLPWISGVVQDEGLLHTSVFYTDEKMFDDFLENIDYVMPAMLSWTYQSDSGTAWLNATKTYYFNNDLITNKSEVLSNLTILDSDSLFFYPAYNALEQHHAVAENRQYFYSFHYHNTSRNNNPTSKLGVAHGGDREYLFPRYSPDDLSEADSEMVDIIVQLFTSFAITGTPSALALNGDTWEPYSTEGNYLKIGDESDTALELRNSFLDERMRFWTALDVVVGEPEAVLEDSESDSGSVTSSPNLLILIFLTCSTFILTRVTADTLC